MDQSPAKQDKKTSCWQYTYIIHLREYVLKKGLFAVNVNTESERHFDPKDPGLKCKENKELCRTRAPQWFMFWLKHTKE